jgi:hypothetical protein
MAEMPCKSSADEPTQREKRERRREGVVTGRWARRGSCCAWLPHRRTA